MKKIVVLLLALAMLFTLMACGNGTVDETEPPAADDAGNVQQTKAPEPAGTEPGNESEDTGEPEASGSGYYKYDLPLTTEEVEFSIWTNQFSTNIKNAYEDMNDLAFYSTLRDRTGVNIDWMLAGSDGWQEMNILISVGDLPDGVAGLGTQYTGGEAKAYEEDVILSLNDYMDEHARNYKYILESDENQRKACTIDGQVLGFYKLRGANEFPSYILAIRQDWLDELNMEAPQTIDEYHDVLTAFKTELGATDALYLNTYGITTGGHFGGAFGINAFYAARQTQYMLFVEDGKVKWSPFEEGFRDYLQTFVDWYSEGLIFKDFVSDYNSESDMNIREFLLAEGRTGVGTTLIAQLGSYDTMSGGTWSGAYVPAMNKGETTHFSDSIVTFQAGNGMFMTTGCSNPELFCEWCDYLYSEEGQLLHNYGPEGETLYYDAQGNPQIDYDVLYNNVELFGEGRSENMGVFYYLGADAMWTLNDASPRLGYFSEAQLTAIERAKYNTDNANCLPQGLVLNSEEKEEFNNLFGDIDTYFAENYLAFIMGSKPMSEYDGFVQKLKDMGGERLIEIYQGAYDRYNA